MPDAEQAVGLRETGLDGFPEPSYLKLRPAGFQAGVEQIRGIEVPKTVHRHDLA
jgi:hypothetical protein